MNKIKIVLPDRMTITRGTAADCAGDLDIGGLHRFGEVYDYDRIPDELLIQYLSDADAVLCNKALITREVMANCPKLRYVGLYATGYNNVDIKAAEQYGITVCNVPGYSTDAVAQHAIALILHFASRVGDYNSAVQGGMWQNMDRKSYFRYPLCELSSMTLGIYGYGAIGKKTAAIAAAMGMRVIVNTRTYPKDCPFEVVDFDTLLRESDFLSIHCPLTDDTRHSVNGCGISQMKKTAYIINTSRGPIIKEDELVEALRSGRIAGAGLDVIEKEPMQESCELLGLPNCVITPHVAWSPMQTRERLERAVEDNLEAFLNGRPINVVNP